MHFELQPPTAAAGIALGATRSNVLEQCSSLGSTSEFRRGHEVRVSLVVERDSGLTIFVYFDSEDAVEAIEFGRPPTSRDVVSYEGIDIFATPADDLIDWLRKRERVDVTERGSSVTAPGLLLALWRPLVPEYPQDENGRYFESVLVARPGYYT